MKYFHLGPNHMPIFLAFITVLSSLFAVPAFAQNQFIRCVQNQLRSLSLDPGPADGQLGPQTQNALEKYRKDRPEFAGLPDITDRFAVNWCRELGAQSDALARFIPSAKPAVILYDEAPDSTQGLLILEQYFKVRKFYKQAYNIKLASRVDLAASHSVSLLTERLNTLSLQHNNRRFVEKNIRKRCNPERRSFTAFASRSLIGICFLPKQVFNDLWFDRMKAPLGYGLAHEYFHQIQRELSADKRQRYYKKGHRPPRRYMWPSWMVEGSAEVFGYLYLEQEMGRLRRFDQVFRKAYRHKQTLHRIAQKPYLKDTPDYLVSFLAAEILARRFGPQSLLEYWRTVGTGLPPEEAFSQVFGLTLPAYEQEFEALRKDIRLAKEFIQKP